MRATGDTIEGSPAESNLTDLNTGPDDARECKLLPNVVHACAAPFSGPVVSVRVETNIFKDLRIPFDRVEDRIRKRSIIFWSPVTLARARI